MNKIILSAVLAFAVFTTNAQKPASMQVATDKDIYFVGDSLHWQCALEGFGKRFNAVTIQLWIEHIRSGEKWRYRFPVINGYAEGAMQVGADLPPGRYAFNFVLQPDFFNVAGTLSRPKTKDSLLCYLLLFKDKETIVNQAKVLPDGSFTIRGLVFQDTAMCSFSTVGRRQDPPNITIATSLDSAFTPLVPVITKFVNIGSMGSRDSGISSDIQQSKDYRFAMDEGSRARQLAEVVVKEKRTNRLLKDYQEAYVTPGFNTADALILDGLSNDEILKAGDIYSYLMMHVPGLNAIRNPETGTQEISWRNSTPVVYVDEFRLPDDAGITVQPGEVAMIKVFRPGSGPLTGGNSNSGAIAIYTKIGPYSRFLPVSDQQSRFYIRGYDGRSIRWGLLY